MAGIIRPITAYDGKRYSEEDLYKKFKGKTISMGELIDIERAAEEIVKEKTSRISKLFFGINRESVKEGILKILIVRDDLLESEK
jgi:hypothetical protein